MISMRNPYHFAIQGSESSTIADALDTTGLTWTRGGSPLWSAQTVVTHDGVDAAQSGDVQYPQESWLEASVMGPAQLSFWWKVSGTLTNWNSPFRVYRKVRKEFLTQSAGGGTINIPAGSGYLAVELQQFRLCRPGLAGRRAARSDDRHGQRRAHH